MVAQLVAQLPELRLPLILETELEGLLGNVMIQPLHPRVGPQQLQALAVGLPQELHPGHEDGAVGAVLRAQGCGPAFISSGSNPDPGL